MSVKREAGIDGAAAHAAHAAAPAAPSAAAAAAPHGPDRKHKKPFDPKDRIVFPEPPDEHTFRIMISTDNHLGYLELDPIRKDDSFHSFREMLQCARDNHVDMVLLGGDLFHDNKPSRATLCRTVEILRAFTFGERPIAFEIISDQEDPNFNVALPIFSIHGNHDDPSGAGNYSTMDLLHNCVAAGTPISLANGKTRPIEEVEAGDVVLSYTKAADGTSVLTARTVTARLDRGVKDCLELTLADGRTLRCTPDHRLLTSKGWIEAQHLLTGDDASDLLIGPHVVVEESGAVGQPLDRMRLVRVKPVGALATYDLTVAGASEDEASFLANGVAVHNCSLVNYFGRIERVDQIVNYPVLMTKGSSKLALYGMGNVRDERLHRTFEMDGVKWEKPQGDPSQWFHLCVVHQNRTRHTLTQRDFLPEKFLPPWLDMVVWGHEHECVPEPVESVEGQYFVLQPGSSVATSLSGGESVDKKVILMEVLGDQYRTVPVPLYTTRPFLIADVRLADDLDPSDATPEMVEEYLTEKINQAIHKIKNDARYQNPDRPQLPLIRLRVEYTGFPRITNINKFGQKFVGKVANPEDLLLFSKQKAVSKRGPKGEGDGASETVDRFLHGGDVGERDRPPPIHELVSLLIRQSKGSLSVLSEKAMADMVDEYVHKKDTDAILNGVERAIKTMTVAMKDERGIQDRDGITPDEVERYIKKKQEQLTATERAEAAKNAAAHAHLAEVFGLNMDVDLPVREPTLSEAEAMEEEEEADGDGEARPAGRKKAASARSRATTSSRSKANGGTRGRAASTKARGGGAKGKGKAASSRRKKKDDDEDEEMDEEEEEEIEDSEDGDWGAPASSSASSSRARRVKPLPSDEEEEDSASVAAIDAGDDGVGDEDESGRPSKKQRKAAPSAAAKKAAASIQKTTGTTNAKKRTRAALSLSSTSSSSSVAPAAAAAPAPAPAAASFFGRRATPAPGSSDLIDLSQMEDEAENKMEDEGIEEMSKGWGTMPAVRKR